MADSQPLTEEERAELEALRAEKAAREQAARDAAERAELEALRAEQAAAEAAPAPVSAPAPAPQPAAQPTPQPAPDAVDAEIAAARARGRELMEPDDDLNMPLPQKVLIVFFVLVFAYGIYRMFLAH